MGVFRTRECGRGECVKSWMRAGRRQKGSRNCGEPGREEMPRPDSWESQTTADQDQDENQDQ